MEQVKHIQSLRLTRTHSNNKRAAHTDDKQTRNVRHIDMAWHTCYACAIHVSIHFTSTHHERNDLGKSVIVILILDLILNLMLIPRRSDYPGNSFRSQNDAIAMPDSTPFSFFNVMSFQSVPAQLSRRTGTHTPWIFVQCVAACVRAPTGLRN